MSETDVIEKEAFVPRWDDLEYRIRPQVLPAYDWLRCQVGRVHTEKRDPKLAPQSVFELLGFGRTMPEAEEMAEKKVNRNGH